MMKAIVKAVYPGKKLKMATEDGYKKLELSEGRELELELVNQRRCVGYHSDRAEMKPCPKFREIEKADQCPECRRKDIYTGWRQGNSSPDFEAEYSVYLALCGSQLKVGVVRTGRLETRWKEQGADYAAEIKEGLTGEKALEIEEEIAGKGVSERVRKEKKLEAAERQKLEKLIEELGYTAEIKQLYPESFECSKLVRKGRFPSPIKNVKGQIVSNGKIGMALTSGKLLVQQKQRGLGDF